MRFCNCITDGFCSTYQRDMTGRFREICAGVDIDLGTAASFREQWTREAGAMRFEEPPIPLLLETNQAPGDAVAMTAAIYSLHKAHPGRYWTAVESSHPEVFAHNPYVVPLGNMNAAIVKMHYPAIHQSNHRAIHFMQGWCEHLGRALGTEVPLLTNRPHLYFDGPPPKAENVWIICSGGKNDFTNKLWGQHNYQEVVDRLKGKVDFVQVGSAGDDHPLLRGVYNMVGRTSLRELFNLVRLSRGVLCGVSLLMHVAAALEKPAIVIAGGREPVAWNAYPKQQYVHTVGALSCVSPQEEYGGACWRSRVVPLGDGTALDDHPCQRPVNATPTALRRTTLPGCMAIISPEDVTNRVLTYNEVVTLRALGGGAVG